MILEIIISFKDGYRFKSKATLDQLSKYLGEEFANFSPEKDEKCYSLQNLIKRLEPNSYNEKENDSHLPFVFINEMTKEYFLQGVDCFFPENWRQITSTKFGELGLN